ncbi:MAG TPA: DNA repair protein RecO [Chthoniobacter sp.]|jgi:DNA repair protein RecO (recombination protein O)
MLDVGCFSDSPAFSSRPLETTSAILLRKTKLTETSLIISWFTEAHGRIKTVAKGARQPKSRFVGLLDLFFDCEIQFARSRKSELHILREVVLRNPREGLRVDYGRVALGAYFVELIELVTELDHPAPELHDLLARAFDHLNEKPPSLRALLHFETELARLLGIQGQENVTSAVAIGRAYHRLPQGRPALLKSLK